MPTQRFTAPSMLVAAKPASSTRRWTRLSAPVGRSRRSCGTRRRATSSLQRQIVIEEGCERLQGLLLGKPDIEPSVKLAARENFLSMHGDGFDRPCNATTITAAE